ncbi:MAG: hypothetical protein COW67_07555 [Flavobacteriales bacterium CG18_big_fil_WC_8_21_14_2_50_32_9]|nr:MAG: hypothetical protein COW67_07555 [Flavobacteriales bacterium CG18_big_fil_WC_8_21_14_2_50_32_9]
MKNRKLIGNLVAYIPLLIYLIYTVATMEPNSGISWSNVLIAGVIGVVSSTIATKIKNKDKDNTHRSRKRPACGKLKYLIMQS